MEIIKTVEDAKKLSRTWKCEGLGFVPTMGFLHEGHMSLARRSVSENGKTVLSIFVNPTQFGPNEDYESYPRKLEADFSLCREAGVDMVFCPQPEEMYPPDSRSFVDMGLLTETLCGASRPGHFRGVCTVVCKLLNIVSPDKAYFGKKDAQQLAVIRRMVSDLNMDAEIVGCPIIREPDGLAMSSRNSYLSPEERQASTVLSRAVSLGRRLYESGEGERVLSEMRALISSEPLARIDYVEAVDGLTMEPAGVLHEGVLIALAVFFGKTRLIDNFTVGE